MDSSVLPKDDMRFLRVCHHISAGLYNIATVQPYEHERHELSAVVSQGEEMLGPYAWMNIATGNAREETSHIACRYAICAGSEHTGCPVLL